MTQRIPPHIAAQVTNRVRLDGRTYLLLEALGASRKSDEDPEGEVKRHKGFDPRGGPRGAHRLIWEFPRRKINRRRMDVLMACKNSHMAHIYDCGIVREKMYVVMDWIEGRPLSDYLRAARTLSDKTRKVKVSATQAVRLFTGFAHGLCFFNHVKNLVHGDLSPANLVVRRQPSELVIIDFGSAWLVERTMRREIGDGHTEHYQAPELNDVRAAADFRSDMFSASVIYFEMLSHKLPYGGIGGKAGLNGFRKYAVKLDPPSRICPYRDQLSARAWSKIDEVVMTGLQLDPDKRYPNGRDWINALESARHELRTATELSMTSRALTAISDGVAWVTKPLR